MRLSLQSMPLIGVNLKIINMGMTNEMKFYKIFKKKYFNQEGLASGHNSKIHKGIHSR
jgi:hypothetical protein